MVEKILFVCTGNTCRSAMAAYLAADFAQKKYPQVKLLFDSAGLMAADNIPATAEAQDVLAQRGIDMSHHRSKLFKAPMVEKADVILVMTSAHKKALLYNFPQGAGKTFTLGELSGSGEDVHDPYCGSHEIYEETAAGLAREIAVVLDKIVKQELKM